MMENATKTYSENHLKYLIDQALEISLRISENRYNIPIENLFKMSARKNKKRDFLFVSRVIGKHIPMNPMTLKIIGGILARLWIQDRDGIFNADDMNILVQALKDIHEVDLIENNFCNSSNKNYSNSLNNLKEVNKILETPLTLKNKTLFIGFAETATGLAQAVFENFSNAYYIHTTREIIKSISPNFIFKEEHSHAVNHLIYAPTKDYFKEFDEIVLIDDELTTGKTACNLIKNLPGNDFGVISILDWRNAENITHVNNQKKYNKNILVSSLIKGTIECNKIREITSNSSELLNSNNKIHSKSINFTTDMYTEDFSKFTGRFGLCSKDNIRINGEIKNAAEILKKERLKGNCLCLGTGEFMYVPCMIASELGENIFYHSTTRSPIYPLSIPNYGNKNKIEFESPGHNGIANYLYNIPNNFYSQVFFFTEKPLIEEKKKEFEDIFSTFNIQNIVFVSFRNEEQ